MRHEMGVSRKEAAWWRYDRFLERQYHNICPYEEKTVERFVRRDFQWIAALFAPTVIGVIVWNRWCEAESFWFLFGCCALLMYVISLEIPKFHCRVLQQQLLQEWIAFLAGVKHHYLSEHNVINAIWESAADKREEVRRHAMEQSRILMGNYRKEKVREYVLYTGYHQYLKLFLVQAYETSEKGDAFSEHGGSLFAENLERLRMELMEERYRRKKQDYEFTGYLLVVLAPVLAMPLLRQWGIGFSDTMLDFYRHGGKLLEVVTLLVTFYTYRFLQNVRYAKANPYKSGSFMRMLKMGYLEQEAYYEVRQFQTVLLMERGLDGVTIPELLENMEIFSRIFREVLRVCINSYLSGPEKALRKMKEEGTKIHPAFGELADSFLAVDAVGVAGAFAEVENNRLMLDKMVRLEEEISFRKHKGRLDLAAYLPSILAVGGYFILPFLFQSLQSVSQVMQMLEELQW